MIARKHVLSGLYSLNIVFLSYLSQTFVSGRFIILHVDVPSLSELNELVSLKLFDLF